VASTIGQVALLTTAPRPARLRATLAITGAPGRSVSLAWAGPVPRRVAALLAPPPRRQLTLLAIVAILILTAGASAAEAARDLHALLEFAQTTR
jgi:pimeloyl-ACP methyl ester carboxylesterase